MRKESIQVSATGPVLNDMGISSSSPASRRVNVGVSTDKAVVSGIKVCYTGDNMRP
jgi:hypothetical protein